MIGTALLLTAIAATPAASAGEGIAECVENRNPVFGPGGEPTEIPGCEVQHFEDCLQWIGVDEVEYLMCTAKL